MNINERKSNPDETYWYTITTFYSSLHDIRLIPDPFDAILVVFELLLTITDVDCDVASAFGDVTGLRDVFMLAKTVSRCFGSKYCCIIAKQLVKYGS